MQHNSESDELLNFAVFRDRSMEADFRRICTNPEADFRWSCKTPEACLLALFREKPRLFFAANWTIYGELANGSYIVQAKASYDSTMPEWKLASYNTARNGVIIVHINSRAREFYA